MIVSKRVVLMCVFISCARMLSYECVFVYLHVNASVCVYVCMCVYACACAFGV